MAKSATLAIRIVSDAKGAAAGFADAESRVAGFQRGLDKASVAAGGVLAGIAGVGKAAFDAASELQQSTGAVESVFGRQSAAVLAFAEDADQAVGLSANSYQELAAVIGSQLRNAGTAHDELGAKTDDLIGLGADLAATYGGTTADAVAALSSLMRGETDPIERYGVAIKASDVAARMAADGTDKLTGSQAKLAQQQALMSLLAEQTGPAVGAFGREANTAAGQTQRASAAAQDAAASLGEALLPIVAEAAPMLADLAGWVSENSDTVQTWGLVIGGGAVAILALNAGMRAYRATMAAVAVVQGVATVAQRGLNLAMKANPIGTVVTVVTALAAGFALAYDKIDWFADAVDWAWQKLKDFWEWLSNSPVGELVGSIFGAAGPAGGAGAPGASVGAALMGAPAGAAGGPLVVSASAPMSAGGGRPRGFGGPPGEGAIIVNVTFTGALIDPVSAGRAIDKVVRQYGTASGRRVALQVST